MARSATVQAATDAAPLTEAYTRAVLSYAHRVLVVDVSPCAACAGAEQLVAGECVAGPLPCDDGDGCTVDECDEQFGTCFHTLSNSSTDGCSLSVCGGPRCVPLCPLHSQCGSDGWSARTRPHL